MSDATSLAQLQRQVEQLEAENQSLQVRLEEAEETLTAIREGAVDALVINTPEGQKVFSLEGAESAYRALIEQMQEGAGTLTPDGTIHYCNRAFAALLKRPMETVVGSRVELYIREADRTKFPPLLREGIACSAHGEVALVAADDHVIPVHIGLTRVVDGSAGLVSLVVTDLTERKQHEARILRLNEELEQRVMQRTAELHTVNLQLAAESAERKRVGDAAEQQRQLLAVTLASIGDAVIVTDAQGRVSFLNAEAERLTGWRGDVAVGQPLPTVFRIINEETRRPVENPVDKVLRLGTVVGLANHTVLISRDGRETPIDDSAALIRQRDGTAHGVVLVFRDFSEQKAAEKALRESELRFRTMADAIAQLAWVAESDGFVSWYNQRWYVYTGTTPQRMEGWGWQSVHDPAVLPTVLERWKAALATGEPAEMEFPLRGADGRFRWFLTRVIPLKDAEGRVVRWFGTSTDVSALRDASEALRQKSEELETAINGSGGAQWEIPMQEAAETPSDLMIVGPQLKGFIGFDDDEFPDSVSAWQARIHPDDLPTVQNSAAAHAAGQSGMHRVEFRIRHKDGSWRWIASSGRLFRDPQGKPLRWAGVDWDITERKRIEEELNAARLSAERAKASAEAASKAKDHFLAVLSHELRTPLTPVVAALSMLQDDPRFDADAHETLEMIRRNVELEARLIDDLLDVTRIERGKVELDRQLVDLGTIIRRAAEVCMPDIEVRRLEFGIDMPAGRYVVNADPARLQQVFWNLLKNAIKFTPPGGCVGIRCRRDGEGVIRAEINDSGEGIAPDMLPRLFNAFEQGDRRVTRQFGGLGLGLAISKAITEMHGGTLTAQNEGKGKGTTFALRLPLARSETVRSTAPTTPIAAAASASTRSMRILLVEDHGDTARVMRRFLMAEGHEVEIAADVATALKLASEKSFDLLLSDLGLPDGSGLDLMRALRAKGLVMPGIALTGYGQEQDLQQSRQAGFVSHLIKPVSFPKLEEAIAKLGAGDRPNTTAADPHAPGE